MQINQIRIQKTDFRVPQATLDTNYQLKLCNEIAPRWIAAECEEERGIRGEITSNSVLLKLTTGVEVL